MTVEGRTASPDDTQGAPPPGGTGVPPPWLGAWFGSTRLPIAWLDADGVVVESNPAMLALHGHPRGEVVGRPFHEAAALSPEDGAALRALFGAVLAGARLAPVEVRLRTRAGGERWVAAEASLLRPAGAAPLVEVVCRDVTARREAMQDLEARAGRAPPPRRGPGAPEGRPPEDAAGRLAGRVAHDLGNVLTTLIGNAELARRRLAADHPVRPFLDRTEAAARRIAELADRLLAFSGRGRFEVARLDLSDVVREVVDAGRPALPPDVGVETALQPGLWIEGDARQVAQAVEHLLANAVEAAATSGGGTVRVTTRRAGPGEAAGAFAVPPEGPAAGAAAVLTVEDEGAGMDAATRRRLFTPFHSTKAGGRGLGLAAVAGIVRAHRGGIRVASEPGRGSAFEVFLPRANGDGTQEDPRMDAEPQVGRGAILVVDDEEAVRDVAALALEDAGWRVLPAEGGRAALEIQAAHGDEIALVLLDLTMPDMTGEETLLALRRRDPSVPVLLCSGYTEQDAVTHLAGQGLAGFLQKPYRPSQLIARVSEILGHGPA